jgi:hypothetical protein
MTDGQDVERFADDIIAALAASDAGPAGIDVARYFGDGPLIVENGIITRPEATE